MASSQKMSRVTDVVALKPLAVCAAIAAILAGCTSKLKTDVRHQGTVEQTAKMLDQVPSLAQASFAHLVDTASDLPACSDAVVNALIYVVETKTFEVCRDNAWQTVDLSPAATAATAGATAANTAAALVKRDASGNFSAGTITADIVGNVSGSAGAVAANHVTGLTAGSVPFATGTGLGQDNAELFWDNGSKSLGLGTNAPATKLDVQGGITGRGGVFEQKLVFTPTTVGWYRIIAAATDLGGIVRIFNAGYDNTYTDVELQFNIGAFGTGGSIQETRYSSFNGGVVSQARISSDGASTTFLDIYISSATAPAPITVAGYGALVSAFIPNPTVGAVAGSTDVSTLTLGHGLRTTSTLQGLTMTLKKNTTAPFACGAAQEGAVALNSNFMLCVCNGSGAAWVSVADGSTSCSW